MTKLFKTPLYLSLFLGFAFNCCAQNFSDIYFYNLFDQNIGIENTDLYQGIIYTTEYRTSTDKTAFFKNKNFVKGSVVYDGQLYHNLDLKYDISADRVLIKLVSKAGGSTLILFNDILEGFKIEGSNFIQIRKSEAPEIGTYGFHEVSLKSPYFTLYTKFNRQREAKRDRNSLYYDFVDKPSHYVLRYNQKYHLIKSKKDIKNLFPNLKKEIDKFYGLASRLRKSNRDDFQVALFKRIEALLSQNLNTL